MAELNPIRILIREMIRIRPSFKLPLIRIGVLSYWWVVTIIQKRSFNLELEGPCAQGLHTGAQKSYQPTNRCSIESPLRCLESQCCDISGSGLYLNGIFKREQWPAPSDSNTSKKHAKDEIVFCCAWLLHWSQMPIFVIIPKCNQQSLMDLNWSFYTCLWLMAAWQAFHLDLFHLLSINLVIFDQFIAYYVLLAGLNKDKLANRVRYIGKLSSINCNLHPMIGCQSK